MKLLTATLLCFVALLVLHLSAQATTFDTTPDKPLVEFGSTAPQLFSFQSAANTTSCDLCDGSGKLENISFVYSGPNNTTVTFQVSNPDAGVLKTVTVDNGDLITLDASDIAGRDHLGNNVQIIINGVNGNNPIQLWVNGSQSNTEKGGTAFHTSCSPGTPDVGDVIGSAASNPTYAFEVIGGGNQGDPNACPATVIDLECAATAAPLLDFQNLTDAGQAPEGGDELKFTAPFINNAANATANATGVEVTVTFPTSQFTYVAGTATGGSSQNVSNAASGEIAFTINSLAPGATATLMFNLTVNSGATSGNVAAAVTDVNGTDVDSTPGSISLPPEDDECQTGFTALPVELTAFEAQADGRTATLRWQTASETNNAGFELQHRYLGQASKATTAAFSALAFIEGHGTTEAAQDYVFRLDALEPGRHVFRLKQIDYDGTFAYSPEIEVAIELPEAYLVSAVYPNPFNPQASFSFSVSRSQEVTVAVYNMLGQRVSVLFEGVVSEGTSRTMQIDGSGLQSGTYIVRVQGEVFVHTQTITLVK